MKTQTIYVDACTSTGIAIGRRNTYATEQIVFGLAPLVQQYGAGSAVLMVLRPTDTTPYPAVTSQSGTELTWTVSATDTSVPGTGECELYWYVDGGLAKSVIFPLTIQRDIITEPIDEPPEPYQTWVDDLTELGAETLQNAQAAAQSATDAENAQGLAEDAKTAAETAQGKAETAQGKAETAQEKAETAQTAAEAAADRAEDALEEFTTPTASATTLAPTAPATASYANGHFTFGIPQGVPGDPGDPGATPDFSIGTVQTLQPTEKATASITGTAEHPVLNLGIPQGVQGDPATNLVQSVNGKTGAVVLGAGDIGYDGETTYPDASVGKELGTINSALTSLSSVTEIIDTASGAIASFPDGAGLPMRSLLATIEPQQDLHGYDAPWAAGAGKNKLQFLTANIKTLNTTGTWSGNAYTINGVTFTINEQNGVPVSVSVTGTATENVEFVVGDTPRVSGTSYIASGCPSGGSTSTYRQVVRLRQGSTSLKTFSEIGSGVTIDSATQTGADIIHVGVWIYSRYAISGTLTFQPMVRLSSVSDATFSPYSNICPISGHTGLSGWVEDEYDPTAQSTFSVSWQSEAGTVYGGTATYNGDGTWTVVADHFLYVYDGTEEFDKSGTALNGFYNNLINPVVIPQKFPAMINYGDVTAITSEISSMFTLTRDVNKYKTTYGVCYLDSGMNFDCDPATFGSTVQSFKAKLAEFYSAGTPVSVFAKIATPLTYTITTGELISTLVGQNNVFVDTGDVSVTYQASIKGYIDKVLGS